MIEAIAELFVERVPRAAMRPTLIPATRLLVVDACGKPRRIPELVRALESSAPLKASYVGFALVNEVPAHALFDQVWLFVDGESDLAYCGLYVRELGDRFDGARVRLVGIGDLNAADCSVVLDEVMVGGGPPWRRRRELSRGAELLRAELVVP